MVRTGLIVGQCISSEICIILMQVSDGTSHYLPCLYSVGLTPTYFLKIEEK